MRNKAKPPAKHPSKADLQPGNQPMTNPLRQADNRWQRTVRYGWDKGGSRGGRK
jgi:hypothetical protein